MDASRRVCGRYTAQSAALSARPVTEVVWVAGFGRTRQAEGAVDATLGWCVRVGELVSPRYTHDLRSGSARARTPLDIGRAGDPGL